MVARRHRPRADPDRAGLGRAGPGPPSRRDSPKAGRPERPRVAFATFSGVPDGSPDDRLALEALGRQGVEAVPAIWDSPEADWAGFDLVVVRSTWDYPLRRPEFLRWVDRVSGLAPLWNPPGVVRWNSHKSYLVDLAHAGYGVVPTELVARGSRVRLEAILGRRGWSEAVVKPAVGSNVLELFRVSAGGAGQAQPDFERLLHQGDVLVQPFLGRTGDRGERSLVFFDGRFSHAVTYPAVLAANPRQAQPFTPSPEDLRRSEPVLDWVGGATLYARLDYLPEGDEGWLLGELELVEPELFLRSSPSGVRSFVASIRTRLRSSSPAYPD
ncbi:MAG: hypothetical protein L3J96_05370 [Thermoplasmata archaeon]|nr:hypothetical protein [Thermoplasmata archaeon]